MRATALGLDFTSSERKVLGDASDSFQWNPIPGKSIQPINATPSLPKLTSLVRQYFYRLFCIIGIRNFMEGLCVIR